MVYAGDIPSERIVDNENYNTVMQWAERHKRMEILGTADTAEDITTANCNGAEGIGLCRVERFFFKEGRLNLMRRFILTEDATSRSQWLVQMTPLLQQDFFEIFSMTGNCQMAVRLLDPCLSEFLPSPKSPSYEAELYELSTELGLPVSFCDKRIKAIQEENPLLGFRGAKLGLVNPEIIEMQIRAIIGAAVDLKRRNFVALPQIILPALCTDLEVERISTVSDNVCAKAWSDSSFNQQYLKSKIGCMLETPRACIQAHTFAKSEYICDVLFNVDVLTALVFGMTRDDSYTFIVRYFYFYFLCVLMTLFLHIYYALYCDDIHYVSEQLRGPPPGGARPFREPGPGRRGQHHAGGRAPHPA